MHESEVEPRIFPFTRPVLYDACGRKEVLNW